MWHFLRAFLYPTYVHCLHALAPRMNMPQATTWNIHGSSTNHNTAQPARTRSRVQFPAAAADLQALVTMSIQFTLKSQMVQINLEPPLDCSVCYSQTAAIFLSLCLSAWFYQNVSDTYNSFRCENFGKATHRQHTCNLRSLHPVHFGR